MRFSLLIAAILSLSCAAILAFSSRSSAREQDEVVVSVASSLGDVMQELAGGFQLQHPSCRILLNVAATGALQVQIEQGAPVHVFAGAAASHLDQLSRKGLLASGGSRQLCLNSMVLVVRPELKHRLPADWSALTSSLIGKLGIGDPAYVPAGRYAVTLLQEHGLQEATKAKCIFASNVREALAWVECGAVDAALVYLTDALRLAQAPIVAETSTIGGKPISYHIAMMRRAENDAAAKAFLDYVSGDDGRAVMRAHGFIVPELSP